MRRLLSITKKHLKSNKKLFLQIILRWLLPTTISVWCMITWESTRKHFRFTKKHLKSIKKLFLQIILHLATSYNNIGVVYDNMGEYSKALSFYEKALEIRQKTLPPNHPDLATSYNNIGVVYDNMGEYSKALSFYEKALEIRQKTLPPNHPFWLLPTTTSVWCMITWESTRKHFHILNVLLTFNNVHYLLIILIFKMSKKY